MRNILHPMRNGLIALIWVPGVVIGYHVMPDNLWYLWFAICILIAFALALIVHECWGCWGSRPRKSPFGVGRCVLVSTCRFHRKGASPRCRLAARAM